MVEKLSFHGGGGVGGASKGGSAMHQNTRETWDAKGCCVRWKKQPAVDMLTIYDSKREFEGP